MVNITKISDNVDVHLRPHPYGFGYRIVKVEVIDEKRYRTYLFYTHNYELAKQVFQEIDKTKEIPETFPNTSNETGTPQILKIEQKHITNYHIVNTYQDVLDILKYHVNLQKDYIPKIEKIENIDERIGEYKDTIEKVKELKLDKYAEQEAIRSLENQIKNLKESKYDYSDYLEIQKLLDGKYVDLREINDFICKYTYICEIELIEPIKIEQ